MSVLFIHSDDLSLLPDISRLIIMWILILRDLLFIYTCAPKKKMKLCSFIAYTLNSNLHSVDDKKLEIIVVFPP